MNSPHSCQSPPQFRTMSPVCHYPQIRCYWPLTDLFWAPISHQMPPVQPLPAPGRNSPMHYSQWAKQLGKRMGKEQGEKGLSLLAAQSMHLKMGWAFPGWISGRSFQALINHTTYPSSSGKRCGFPRWWWTFLHLFPISAPQLWTKPVMNSGDQNISICFASCWKALFVSL